jgi:uncharacterized protein
MVGRLARYLRFVGCDTAYLRGLSDDEILRQARSEDRVLLTRDRALARRAPRAVLLESPFVEAQWREVRLAYPDLPTEVRFDRCTECNGRLSPYVRGTDASADRGLPASIGDGPRPLFRCTECGHLYWEGSHTDQIRSRLAGWCAPATP